MKKITHLITVVVMLFTALAFSQSTITGTVIDADLNASLPGASVVEKGTSNGTTTDFDGNFSLKTQSSTGEIEISYVGFSTKEMAFSGDQEFGTVNLESSEFGLQEVMIIASVAVDRKTPVAVSTIKSADIELRLGTQEFPEILKSTPGVYATKAGGGYGDGRINLRGFNSENVAVMINGVPVNDMENGRVFWSNWAGLADVTSSMQVQRGLGASKVAVPSIGGTINILTKTTDVEQGGNFFSTLGNDGYLKYGLTYSTGLNEKGFAATVAGAKTEGDGYVDGTGFTGVSYFINLSKQLGENHKLSFTAFGAKQRHGQRQNRHIIEDYRLSEQGIKLNTDWGYKNGQVVHVEDNFYHKPQLSLNHYWNINEKSSLSTAVYASWGSGGGGGTIGSDTDGLDGRSKFSSADYKIGVFGPMDLDRIVDENIALGAQGSSAALRASRNDHNWYGILSTFKTDLSDNLVLLAGLDLRDYKGIHFREVTDLLGGQFIINDDNENNPLFAARVGDVVDYHNDGFVGWLGGFGQLEYSKDKLSAFVSLSVSNTSYKRTDYFSHDLTANPELFETDKYNFGGFGAKGGLNYNLNDNHGVFVNLGYFEKAAGFDSVFYNFNNEDVNPDAENQKIESYELGYTLRSDKLSANVNLYRTAWRDRTETETFQLNPEEEAVANILGVNAIHKGIELDFVYRVNDQLRFTGMASFGDWKWENDVTDVQIFNEAQEVVETVDLYIADLPVSDAAQTTFALGVNYKLSPKTTLLIDYNYYDRIYADFDPSDRGTDGLPDSWQMPDYGLFDAVIRHGFDLGPFDAQLTARMNNVFDTEYISDADDGTGSVTETALVYFGYGRTFSIGAKFNF